VTCKLKNQNLAAWAVVLNTLLDRIEDIAERRNGRECGRHRRVLVELPFCVTDDQGVVPIARANPAVPPFQLRNANLDRGKLCLAVP